MARSGESGEVLKGMVVIPFKFASRHSPGGTEEAYEKCKEAYINILLGSDH
jgi:hypothetical protein